MYSTTKANDSGFYFESEEQFNEYFVDNVLRNGFVLTADKFYQWDTNYWHCKPQQIPNRITGNVP